MVAWKSYRKPLVCEFWRQNVLNTIIIIFTKWWQQTSQMTKSKHKYLQNDRNDSQEFWRQYGMKCTKHSFIRHGLEMTCDYVKSELVNRTQALDKEISGSPTGIKPMNSQTPDRHSTTELWELVESKVIYNNWVLTCMWQASRILLGSALSKSSRVWTLSKTLQISHAVLLRCVNQCSACFFAGLLHFWDVTYAKNLIFPRASSGDLLLNKKQKRPFVSLKDEVTKAWHLLLVVWANTSFIIHTCIIRF